ncbi:MAG: cell wall hydrolase [Oscillospiraceae bacterium]|nr:cell wall hydrolase [Oscillospiraceae bacterium]
MRTIYNRVHDDRFPDTIEGVLKAPKQFENCDKVCTYAKSSYDYEKIKLLIEKVFIDNYDPFDGANVLFYASDKVAAYKVCKGLILVKHEGKSNFYEQE